MVVIRRKGKSGGHRDLRVRRAVVLEALRWLIRNNRYYSNVTIDYDVVDELPEDGTLSDLQVIEDDDLARLEPEDDANVDEQSQQEGSSDDEDLPLQRTVLPRLGTGKCENDIIRDSVNEGARTCSARVAHAQSVVSDQIVKNDQAMATVVDWPAITNQLIDEFNSEGYWSRAFPTLFPTGAGEYLAPRQRRLTLGQYSKHLIRYRDGRFAQHPRFRYFALNTMMRWRALETGRVFVKQRIGENHLSVEEPKEMVNRGDTSFASRVMRFSSSLHGTRQYWCTQRLNLAAMQEALGMPTIFFTLSAADTQWPELQDLMRHYRPNTNQDKPSESIKAVIQNPHLTDWFFLHRAEKFMRYFLQNSLGAVDFWASIEYQHRGSSHLHGVAWLADAPHSDKISSEWACMHRASESGEAEATSEQMRRAEDIAQEVYDFADALVTTWNPTLNETGRVTCLEQKCTPVTNDMEM